MNIKTITTTDGVNTVDFGSAASRFYWFRNIGTTTVYVSGKSDISAGVDGVAELAAGDSVCIETLGGKVYVLGAGKVQIHNTGDKFCPFKNAPAQSGGGTTVDSYSKTESDARYAQKTDIPTTLPANGGNADTVDGMHADDFIKSTNSTINGDLIFRSSSSVNSRGAIYSASDILVLRNISNDGSNLCDVEITNDRGVFINGKEISTTPIKSTTFSGTTNEYGNVVFTAVGNKIPVFAECSPYCGIPLRFNDNYWIHCIDPITNSNSIAANTAVTGTVYYVEI